MRYRLVILNILLASMFVVSVPMGMSMQESQEISKKKTKDSLKGESVFYNINLEGNGSVDISPDSIGGAANYLIKILLIKN